MIYGLVATQPFIVSIWQIFDFPAQSFDTGLFYRNGRHFNLWHRKTDCGPLLHSPLGIIHQRRSRFPSNISFNTIIRRYRRWGENLNACWHIYSVRENVLRSFLSTNVDFESTRKPTAKLSMRRWMRFCVRTYVCAGLMMFLNSLLEFRAVRVQ